MKEQLDIEINLEGEDDLEKIIRDIESGLEPTVYLENQILESTSKRLDKLKKTRAIVNDILKARGDTRKAEIVEDEAGSYSLVLKQQAKKINQDKRETRGLEHLLRRYRWMQSLFLVTQNFLGRMGESVQVFGAGLNLLFAPLSVFLNILLLPALPILGEFTKLMFGAVMIFKDWYDSLGPLNVIIASGLFGAILAVMSLPIVGMIVSVLNGIFTLGGAIRGLIVGIYGVETASTAAGVAAYGLQMALAGLAGAVVGGVIVWGLYETGVMDALATAGAHVGRFAYNSGVVLKNWIDYAVNYAKNLGSILMGDDSGWQTYLDNFAGFTAGTRIDPIGSKTARTPSEMIFGRDETNISGAQPQTITNSFDISMNSSASNSDELYNEFVDRLQREGIARGAVM